MVRVIDTHYKSELFLTSPFPGASIPLRERESSVGYDYLLKAPLKQKEWEGNMSKGRGSNESGVVMGQGAWSEKAVRRKGYAEFWSGGNRRYGVAF